MYNTFLGRSGAMRYPTRLHYPAGGGYVRLRISSSIVYIAQSDVAAEVATKRGATFYRAFYCILL